MGPSSVPSFVPLKGVIGTLSSFGDSFFVKEFKTVSKTRAITLKLLNQPSRYYPREILMFEIHFLHVLRRNVINKYNAV